MPFRSFSARVRAVLPCLVQSCAVVLCVAFDLRRLIARLRGKRLSLDKLLDCEIFVRLRGIYASDLKGAAAEGGTGAIILH